MDVEATGKTIDRADSKEDMSYKTPSPVGRTLKITGVELKIVGETLNILKDFKEKLDLVCVAEGEFCRISFNKGKNVKRIAFLLLIFLQGYV